MPTNYDFDIFHQKAPMNSKAFAFETKISFRHGHIILIILKFEVITFESEKIQVCISRDVSTWPDLVGFQWSKLMKLPSFAARICTIKPWNLPKNHL